MRPDRLLLVGSVIVDVVATIPALPPRGGDVMASSLRTSVGGGYNVLAAASRLGLATALAGHVGGGPNGRLVAEALDAIGTQRLLRTTTDGDTGGCIGLLDAGGECTYITAPGCESRLTHDDLAPVHPGPRDGVYLSGYELLYPVSGPPLVAWVQRERPWLVVDPGPLVDHVPADRLDAVLAHTRVLTLNARELGLLSGDATALRERLAPGGVVVARDGARGCVVHSPQGVVALPSPQVEAVDTTGAGDAHTGALLAALAAGHSLVEATRRADVAAALAVTRPGSATGPSSAELDAALRQAPGIRWRHGYR